MTRTALVTGGASGLGKASAERLAGAGTDVITLDIAPGADVTVDVTDTDAVMAAAGRIGHIDILINSAGIIGPNKPLWEIGDDEWAATFAVNVSGTFNLCRAFVPGMRERGWGRIVNFASMAGKDGNANLSAYSASKAAVIALTKSLGKELATSGVLVNVYRLAAAKVGVPDYKNLVKEKLSTAEELYRFMVDQFHQSRAFVLELLVVVILIIELAFVFYGKG